MREGVYKGVLRLRGAALAAVVLAATPGAAQPLEVPLFDGLGGLHRKVTTSAPIAQRYFDQGLAFLFAFNHDEARRSFQKAGEFDARAPMVWWGVAMANGPHINNPTVSPERAREAWFAVIRAKSLAHLGTPLERDLIRAVSARFSPDGKANRRPLDEAFAREMRQLHRRNPKDADIGAMFAESMMDLRPWDLWTEKGKPQPGTPEIVSTLEHVMKVDADHPLALHLYIHAVEASPNPGKATKAADRLRMRQPGLGHMVHMPSHIDVRTGRWKDAAIANLRAIRADHEYTEHSPDQGFYRLYMAHNAHMLMFAAMMRGQRQVAIDAIDTAVNDVPAEWAKEFNFIADGFVAMPMEVRVRFGMWDEILQMPEPPDYFPMARTMRHAARAISYAAKGETSPARGEFSMFMAARKRVPKGWSFGNNRADHLLQVAYHQVAGEILVAEGKMDKGIAELRKAVVVEDQLRYDEPPDWIQPSRHTLGAALMRASKFREAEKVYREDLVKLPGNGWSLYGLSEALREQGKAQESMMFRDKFEVMWAEADTKITSSCLCMPR